jgi:1-acyl-sn-glycerol-3-phosphate acyltransferase
MQDGVMAALTKSVAERVDRLEIPFNRYGVDRYGVSKKHLTLGMSGLSFLYKHYFSVGVKGIENVPRRGRAMLVGNHSGGVAIDGAMVIASMFLEMDPPRLAQGMVDKFINKIPLASLWANRTGQFTGLPEHAVRLLEDERLLMVFPEGARGTAKLYKDRYSLVDFGTGFMRLALATQTPIIPFAFLGGGDAVPTVANLYTLGKLMGVPYVPVTPYLVAVPLPVKLDIVYGEPIHLTGTGSEDDEVVAEYVYEVKSQIAEMLDRGRKQRERLLPDDASRSTPSKPGARSP